jgi:hypothetical protein
VSAAALRTALDTARLRLQRFVPSADLVDALYFGWFDHPYRRATLAVATKTVAVLERELRGRQSTGPAIRDADVTAALAWLDAALQTPLPERERPGFRPDRVRRGAGRTDETAQGPLVSGAPGLVFADRASATRFDPVLGDFDLLACLGMGAYGFVSPASAAAERTTALETRAEALGVLLVTDAPEAVAAAARRLAVRPQTLAALLAAPPETSGGAALPAVSDPPEGESWGASLARRSLLRGDGARSNAIALGWRAPRAEGSAATRIPSAEAARLALWVHALAGQQWAVLEGWRDLRDGSALSHVPVLTHPDYVEAVAHTALDLLYFAPQVEACALRPGVAVVLDAHALDPQDENRWSPEAAELFDVLLNRQLSFDVVTAAGARPEVLSRYRAVLVAAGGAEASAAAEPWRAALANGVHVVVPPSGGTPAGLMQYLLGLPEPLIARDLRVPADFVAYEPGPRVAPACLVFNGRTPEGTLCLAVANLRAEPRTVALECVSGGEGPLLRDLLSGESITAGRGGVRLGAYQVRLLVP